MSLFSFEYLKWNSSWLILKSGSSFPRFYIKPFFWPQSMIDLMNQVLCGKLLKVWSTKNNNCLALYPICLTQVNFKNKFQIHLDPFRSPPTKVRVGDRDQRVWNDDDDLVADNVPDSDNSNGDQEPSFSSENSQTRSTTRQVCVSV